MRYLILLVLVGCTSTKKQQKKAEEFLNAHPEVEARRCAQNYPPDTTFIKGDTVLTYDTLVTKGDSIPCPPTVNESGDTVYVKVKCPDSKTVTVYLDRVDTVVLMNTALVDYYRFRNDSLNKVVIKVTTQRDDAKDKAANRLWIIVALGIALAAGTFLRIKNII